MTEHVMTLWLEDDGGIAANCSCSNWTYVAEHSVFRGKMLDGYTAFNKWGHHFNDPQPEKTYSEPESGG